MYDATTKYKEKIMITTTNKKNSPAKAITQELMHKEEESRHQQNNQRDYTTSHVLLQWHYEMLKASAISDDVIKERGYRSITKAEDLLKLGFSNQQARVPGLLLPLHATDGQTPLSVYRPDSPRVIEDKKHREADGAFKQKVIKYEMPKGEKMRLDVPPRCRADIGDPAIPLWITEGQKKADALASAGLCSIDLLGVWNFIGTNDRGGKVFLSDFLDIALNNGRPVRIVFDSDLMTKPEVKQALDVLTQRLQRKGAMIQAVYLPGGKNKVGVDDWLAEGHTVEDLEELVEGPRPMMKVAPPVVELLDAAPFSINRPLCLVDGKAYAAIWPYVLTRTTQKFMNGQIVQLKEPEEIKEQALHIVRSDGAIFGPAERPLSSLGIEVALPERPSARDALWSTPGVKDFVQGIRPDPKDVFDRVKSVIARFIDFDRSIADQETMSEMLSCFAISTWFLDAYSVAPYIWANGERGSGKTSLLFILVRLSYLGVSLSPSGSFAALRDLADYGATLGLDDAEDLTDPKKSDPDKRAVLLSGNRKGITVPLKEPNPNGQGWKTREVNCYCPRIFSTIQKPDPTLSSRAIIIPVVRTAQRFKGNADPLDDAQWPCDRQKLIDDLWSMSLTYLAEMPAFDKLVGEESKLIGRDLQPWRAILAVAAWLDSMGVSSLWGKIESLAAGTYQQERVDLEKVDINRIAMYALGEYVARTPSKTEWSFSTQAIVEIMHRLIDDEEIELDKNFITAQKLGHRFNKMRLSKDLNQRPRLWKLTRNNLATMFVAYRIPLPEEIEKKLDSGLGRNIGDIGYIGDIGDKPTNPTNVANVESGENAQFLPEKTCYACGSTAWYIGAAGNALCGVCHPAAVKVEKALK
jgi:hypothetical protein